MFFIVASDNPERIEDSLRRARARLPPDSAEGALNVAYSHHYFHKVPMLDYSNLGGQWPSPDKINIVRDDGNQTGKAGKALRRDFDFAMLASCDHLERV